MTGDDHTRFDDREASNQGSPNLRNIEDASHLGYAMSFWGRYGPEAIPLFWRFVSEKSGVDPAISGRAAGP